MEQQLLTVDEAAALLRVHSESVRRWIRTGKLKAARVGRDYRITREEIQDFWTKRGGTGDLFKKD